MMLLDTIFSTLLSRDQRERHSRSKWDKSVAAAARELHIPTTCPRSPPATPTLTIDTACPMSPSLSSTSTSSSTSSSGSPTRPTTSYSTSPPAPYRRHTSLSRNPISYDCLISPPTTESRPEPQQLLYPLPPLGPMEGIGKYRRAVDASAEYLTTLEKNTISALQPLDVETVESTVRGRRDIPSTTTPPRAYSLSPPKEDMIALSEELELWAAKEEEEEAFEDVEEPRARTTRPTQKRRAHSSRERRNVRSRTAFQGGLARKMGKSKNPKVAAREAAMAASMETLVSGEE